MEKSKKVIVDINKADKVKRFAADKASKRQALKQMPIQDISKLNKVG